MKFISKYIGQCNFTGHIPDEVYKQFVSWGTFKLGWYLSIRFPIPYIKRLIDGEEYACYKLLILYRVTSASEETPIGNICISGLDLPIEVL